jgi:hypothetical protein
LNPAAREWFPPGYQPELLRAETGPDQAVTEPCSPDAATAVLPLAELPAEILSHVVSFLATQDAYSCILTSQQLKAAVRSGRMRFELKGRPRQLLSFPAQARQLDDLVQSLTRHMPGVCCGLYNSMQQRCGPQGWALHDKLESDHASAVLCLLSCSHVKL